MVRSFNDFDNMNCSQLFRTAFRATSEQFDPVQILILRLEKLFSRILFHANGQCRWQSKAGTQSTRPAALSLQYDGDEYPVCR